jgi:hypothetical protein
LGIADFGLRIGRNRSRGKTGIRKPETGIGKRKLAGDGLTALRSGSSSGSVPVYPVPGSVGLLGGNSQSAIRDPQLSTAHAALASPPRLFSLFGFYVRHRARPA